MLLLSFNRNRKDPISDESDPKVPNQTLLDLTGDPLVLSSDIQIDLHVEISKYSYSNRYCYMFFPLHMDIYKRNGYFN